MKLLRIQTVIAAALAFGTVQAQAEWVTFPASAHGGKTVNYSVSKGSAMASGFGYAGGFDTRLNGGTTFTSYCTDLFEYMGFGPTFTNYTLVGGAAYGFVNARANIDIGKLFAAQPMITTELQSTAFQIAVWELAYETSPTYAVGTGSARFSGGDADSSGALALADSWLTALSSVKAGTAINVLESVTTDTETGHQDVVFAAPVPEPSTYALMAAGLMSVGFVARRRARRAD